MARPARPRANPLRSRSRLAIRRRSAGGPPAPRSSAPKFKRYTQHKITPRRRTARRVLLPALRVAPTRSRGVTLRRFLPKRSRFFTIDPTAGAGGARSPAGFADLKKVANLFAESAVTPPNALVRQGFRRSRPRPPIARNGPSGGSARWAFGSWRVSPKIPTDRETVFGCRADSFSPSSMILENRLIGRHSLISAGDSNSLRATTRSHPFFDVPTRVEATS